jgi:hypothetical protein
MTHDLRKYTQQTFFRMIAGGLILMFLIGIGLIYWIYGSNAAWVGLICMLLTLAPLILVSLFMWVIGWIVRWANR